MKKNVIILSFAITATLFSCETEEKPTQQNIEVENIENKINQVIDSLNQDSVIIKDIDTIEENIEVETNK